MKVTGSLILGFLFILLTAISGMCASVDELFDQAVADSKVINYEKISRNLIGISSPNAKNTPAILSWKEINGQPYVLVCTWTGNTVIDTLHWTEGMSYELVNTTFIWVTAVPQLKNFFHDNGFWPETHSERVLRLEQLLGLKPNSGETVLVEFWVKPEDLLRPSADPNPSDHEAQLEYPWKKSRMLTLDSNQKVEDGDSGQLTYQGWFENNNSTTTYPWTRLGYTYDWADDRFNHAHHGLSEFILSGWSAGAHSSIVIEKIIKTEDLDTYLTKPSESIGQIYSKSPDVVISSSSSSILDISELRTSFQIKEQLSSVCPVKSFTAVRYGSDATVSFSYTVDISDSISKPVSRLTLLKLTDSTNITFTYSDQGENSDGTWYLSDLAGNVLSSTDLISSRQIYTVNFSILDNGKYDTNTQIGIIADPQVLGVTNGGNSGCVQNPDQTIALDMMLIVTAITLSILRIWIQRRSKPYTKQSSNTPFKS
ncbi:hypothetical protein SAMN06295933_1448 [Desulfovibrio gilichinskyi]|uniref:Uncharacterized protein n=2 Tax=Desulfovibrio gilichinskyi TaxID=1519643 RepID=A0A1X7CYX6_9BACT|nr:hypothetical protein SAMN06295933_1448 [Desulfovibrio gilichinskyi]